MTITLLHLENCVYEEYEKFHTNISAVFPHLNENNITILYNFITNFMVDIEIDAVRHGNIDYLFNIIAIAGEYIENNFQP